MNSIDIHSLLNDKGLICHTFSFNKLPTGVQHKLNSNANVCFDNRYLTLIANAGPEFWNHLTSHYANSSFDKNTGRLESHWFDQRSTEIVDELLNLTGLKNTATLLYPASVPAPLIPLGELAAWSSASPLGLGVNTHYGPWFAYRALVLTTQPLTEDEKPKRQISPCIDCDAPCVAACPADAVSKKTDFNIKRCAAYRIQDEEPTCKTQCHARNACPVGKPYQYSLEQRAYHMKRALSAIVEWAAKS